MPRAHENTSLDCRSSKGDTGADSGPPTGRALYFQRPAHTLRPLAHRTQVEVSGEIPLGCAYVNMMMEEGQDRIKTSYRDNYGRLTEVKNEYDPGNLFRVNQNVRPTV